MANHDKREENTKQPYEKPKLRVIELAAEEVLAVGCKVNPGDPTGFNNQGCTTGVCQNTIGT
jgi:hypothetical protein